jgi:hypothetical protein
LNGSAKDLKESSLLISARHNHNQEPCLPQLLGTPLFRPKQQQTFSRHLIKATHRSDASASPPGLSIRRTTALIRLLSRTCRSCLISASLPIPLPVLPPLPRLMLPAALMTAIRSLPAVTNVGLVRLKIRLKIQVLAPCVGLMFSAAVRVQPPLLTMAEVIVGISHFKKLKYHILALALADCSGHYDDCYPTCISQTKAEQGNYK